MKAFFGTPRPSITSANAKSGQVGVALSYQMTTDYPATSFAASNLPAGVAINAANGLISGIPSNNADPVASMTAYNGGGPSVAENLAFTILSAAPVINSAATKAGVVGTALSYVITATNGPTSYGASGLPPGLTFSGATISGTPTTPGTYNATISAANDGGSDVNTLVFTITGTVSSPVHNPGTRPIASGSTLSVDMTSPSSGVTIAYTTDGSTPSPTHGTQVANGTNVNITAPAAGSGQKTLSSMAYKTGWNNSAVTTTFYSYDSGTGQ